MRRWGGRGVFAWFGWGGWCGGVFGLVFQGVGAMLMWCSCGVVVVWVWCGCSGCGLVGLSLLIKNMDVIVTDKDSMIETLNYNMKQLIEENNNDNFKINSSYEVASLDWSFFDDTYSDEKKSILKNSIIGDRCVDFIVCSDCLYNSASIRPLLNIINLFSNANTVLIIANELRSALDEFILLARHDDTYRRTFQDIELTEEDIFVYRNNNDNGRYANRPIRLLISSITI
jgi:hypothetical protein